MAVFVLDRSKKPLMPCTEKRARLLLERGRARVHRVQPFTIRLVDRTVEESGTQPLLVKVDPGSKATGIALVRAEVPPGRNAGVHVGRVAVRKKGVFNVATRVGIVKDIHHRHCRLVQRGDGYHLDLTTPQPGTREDHAPPLPEGRGSRAEIA